LGDAFVRAAARRGWLEQESRETARALRWLRTCARHAVDTAPDQNVQTEEAEMDGDPAVEDALRRAREIRLGERGVSGTPASSSSAAKRAPRTGGSTRPPARPPQISLQQERTPHKPAPSRKNQPRATLALPAEYLRAQARLAKAEAAAVSSRAEGQSSAEVLSSALAGLRPTRSPTAADEPRDTLSPNAVLGAVVDAMEWVDSELEKLDGQIVSTVWPQPSSEAICEASLQAGALLHLHRRSAQALHRLSNLFGQEQWRNRWSRHVVRVLITQRTKSPGSSHHGQELVSATRECPGVWVPSGCLGTCGKEEGAAFAGALGDSVAPPLLVSHQDEMIALAQLRHTLQVRNAPRPSLCGSVCV